ncbi:hypothetical protein FOG51_01390 [Hanseniaspora uvarum]|nr:hypothetical protein FOG51_01390 [Hanseniaspora uvarum]
MFTSCIKSSSVFQKNTLKTSFRQFSISKRILNAKQPISHIKPLSFNSARYTLLSLFAVGGYGVYNLQQTVKNDPLDATRSSLDSIVDSGNHIKRELTGEKQRVVPITETENFKNSKSHRHKLYREVVVGCLFGLVGGTTVKYFYRGVGYFITVTAIFLEILAARNIIRLPKLNTFNSTNNFFGKIRSSSNKFINFISKEPVFRGAGLLTFFMAFTA